MSIQNCNQIEELIIKQKTESLNNEEMNQVESHIANCSSCKNFYLIVNKLETSMIANENDSLKPASTIQENLITKLKDQSSVKKSWHLNIIELLRNILSYRIPVYQAGLAAFIIFLLITYGIDFSNHSNNINDASHEVTQIMENPSNNEYMIETHPDINDQKVGVNIREDSSLIAFIYTSM